MIKIMVNTIYPTCCKKHPPHGNEHLFSQSANLYSNPIQIFLRTRVQCYHHLVHKVTLQGKSLKILLFTWESVQHSKEEQRYSLVHSWLQR